MTMIMVSRQFSWVLVQVIVFVALQSSEVLPQRGSGVPIKFLSSCELDLDGNNSPDVALMIDSNRGRELIVLLSNDTGYTAHLLFSEHDSTVFFNCRWGDEISGTDDRGDEVVCETTGAYLVLFQPEGSAIAFYWDVAKFNEVWIAD